MNSSFWFPPTLLTLAAVLLFLGARYLDKVAPGSVSDLSFVFSGSASAARTVLSVIAGSLITVVATVFSITIVTLQLASSQYTPRLLRSFSADRGAQIVLGTYIATFVYCLLVLSIVQEVEPNVTSPVIPIFVPVISVTVAVVLALVCVALLIFFVYHVTNLIQPSTILGRIHSETMAPLSRLGDLDASSAVERDLEDYEGVAGLLHEAPAVAFSRDGGYLQSLDLTSIVEAVSGAGGARVIEIPVAPGAFVAGGLPLLRVWPAGSFEPGSAAENRALQAFVFGQERSFFQDFTFGLRQLSDIALKALSPSVNDPTTAMQAMDRTEDIFIALGAKALAPRVHERQAGGERVLARVEYPTFDGVVEVAFDQVWRAAFATGQVAFLRRLLETLERAIGANAPTERRRALWERAFLIGSMAPGRIPSGRDAAELAERAALVGIPLLRTELAGTVGPNLRELANLAGELPGGERIRETVRSALDGR